eukprot:TRINITY_DN66980_c6_g1_i4.p1 TRINITY_DN66980_c6_g1~~TRINITY_DN66980_c6_g1_i4.p1  ORF type:complete len:451 (+),score=54.20 TRINITY_DN66980_c6_g1_i4:25-1377(+)
MGENGRPTSFLSLPVEVTEQIIDFAQETALSLVCKQLWDNLGRRLWLTRHNPTLPFTNVRVIKPPHNYSGTPWFYHWPLSPNLFPEFETVPLLHVTISLGTARDKPPSPGFAEALEFVRRQKHLRSLTLTLNHDVSFNSLFFLEDKPDLTELRMITFGAYPPPTEFDYSALSRLDQLLTVTFAFESVKGAETQVGWYNSLPPCVRTLNVGGFHIPEHLPTFPKLKNLGFSIETPHNFAGYLALPKVLTQGDGTQMVQQLKNLYIRLGSTYMQNMKKYLIPTLASVKQENPNLNVGVGLEEIHHVGDDVTELFRLVDSFSYTDQYDYYTDVFKEEVLSTGLLAAKDTLRACLLGLRPVLWLEVKKTLTTEWEKFCDALKAMTVLKHLWIPVEDEDVEKMEAVLSDIRQAVPPTTHVCVSSKNFQRFDGLSGERKPWWCQSWPPNHGGECYF